MPTAMSITNCHVPLKGTCLFDKTADSWTGIQKLQNEPAISFLCQKVLKRFKGAYQKDTKGSLNGLPSVELRTS